MKETFINGGSHRYLSELPEFKNGLPHGVVNKTEADRGGTYVAANCSHSYIIVCPYKDLVGDIAANNKRYDVFQCYGGVQESYFTTYCKRHDIKKIAVTYDSLPKLIVWINHGSNQCSLGSFWVLVDEYHLILEDLGFRADAISNLMSYISLFKHYTFLSATPIDCSFEIDFFKSLPHYTVQWENTAHIIPYRCKALCGVPEAVAMLVKQFLEDGLSLPDIDNKERAVEQLFIFFNSVSAIEQICRTLNLEPDTVKICCAEKKRNRVILKGKYEIEHAYTPCKRINFFTKKGFQGCNFFSNNALVVVASDGHREQTLVDISTTLQQIAGRLRENDEYRNCFRHILIHIYNTNTHIMDDDEFEKMMEQKHRDAEDLKEMVKGYSSSQMKLFSSRMNLEEDIVSIVDNKLIDNPLKEQYFRFKQNLRKEYKDGFTIREAYSQNDKFEQSNQHIVKDLDIIMKPITKAPYKEILLSYLENPDEQYEQEYPEFKDFRRYLSIKEINSMKMNKDKMMKCVADKKQMDNVFRAVHTPGFVSNKELKERFTAEFDRRNIDLAPKATLILGCKLYTVTPTRGGYELGELKMDFHF